MFITLGVRPRSEIARGGRRRLVFLHVASPSSSQDGEKSAASDAESEVPKAMPDFCPSNSMTRKGWLGLQDHAATELHDQDMPVITGATILSSSMNVAPCKSDRSRPMNARAKLGYENVSKPRSKFCSFCRGKGHTAS
uniref:Uncharacterized protein n=1 Tax=Triticum urartu TaxID=4572 RepID=A0A8R7VCE4_TRIUA